MNKVSKVLAKKESSELKAEIHNIESRPENMSAVEKMENFMTRLRPRPAPIGVDISSALTVNEVNGGSEEESTLEEGSKKDNKKEDKQLEIDEISIDPNESVGVITTSCIECGLKLLSEADLLKHMQCEHYQQYLLALAIQFFSGSSHCDRCGEIVKDSVAIQLIHIGEKHRQFPR